MLKRPAKALLLALIVVLVVATPVMAYVYRAQYAATNNSTTAYDMMPFIGYVNNEWMAANGFMNASANDTRIETLAGQYKPHMVADNKTLTAIASPANSQTNLYYTTGNSELTDFHIIPGYGANSTVGYVWTDDSATLELGDNFTYQTTGWIDTDNGTGKYLINKPLAFRTFVSEDVSGNITAQILGTAGASEVLRPDGNNQCGLPHEAGVACPNHWQNVDEAVVNDADWNGVVDVAATNSDNYTLQNTAIPADAVITSVVATIRGQDGGGGAYFQVGLSLSGSTTWGAVRTPGGAWTTYNETLARPGGGAWTRADLDSLLIEVRCKALGGGNWGEVSWTYITVNYNYPSIDAQVSATGVSSGEHTVNVMEAPLLWAPGDALHSEVTASSVNCTAIYNNQAKFWMSFWFKLDGDYSSANASALYLMQKLDTVTDKIYMWLDGTDGRLTFRYYDAAEKFKIYGQKSGADITSWNGGQWYNVFWQISDNMGVRLIVDNDTIVTNADTTPLPNGGDLFLGTAFQGLISNVIVGIDNLTPAETSALYYGNLPGDETDLWYMDEGTGTNIVSYGSVANPGTAGATTRWVYETRPCKFVIEIDGTEEDGFARVVSVPDNAEDIIFMDGNSAFYADNITLDIGGARQLWYAPTSYIIGTNLPDRAGTSQNGTFTWGANPTGIGVTFGSMASSGQPSLGTPVDQPTQDILEDVEVSDWFVDPDVGVGGSLLTNPIRPFVTLLSDNSTLTERQVWILCGLAFVLFVTVATSAVVRGHHGITGIMCGAAITGLVSLTVWPLWTLVFVAFAVVAGLVSERSPSL